MHAGKAVAQVNCFVNLNCGGATGNSPTVAQCCMGTQFAGDRGLSYDVGTGCTNCPISELHLKYTVYVDSRVGSTGGVSIVLYYSKILTACSYYNLKVSTS